MSFIHITVRSLTFGQKGLALLKKNGINASLVRTNKMLTDNGCGYSIKVIEREGKRAVEVLKVNNVSFSGIWKEQNRSFERVHL